MSKRKFDQVADNVILEREDFKKLRRANTEPQMSDSQAKNESKIAVPDLKKMQTLNPIPNDELSSDEESHKETKRDTSSEESKSSDSTPLYNSDDETQEEDTKTSKKKINFNVLFYKNKIKSTPQGDYIENILKFWVKDYKKLEIHHGYIQWLFPNFYTSAYNPDAHRLEKEEAKIFREDIEIAERLQRSYKLILGFYGIKLADPATGKLERAENYQERYHATLITSLHNHLRIRRILTHLNNVGFRKYAIELVKFLETEIFGGVGEYKNYLANKKNLSQEQLKKLKSNPLFPIIKYDVFKDWKLYGATENEEEEKKLYTNCFTADPEDYKDSILFKSYV